MAITFFCSACGTQMAGPDYRPTLFDPFAPWFGDCELSRSDTSWDGNV